MEVLVESDVDTRSRPDPDLSVTIPCYNEEECLPETIPPLAEALEGAGIEYELVLVDNGSTDATSEIIDELSRRGYPIVKGIVPQNRGLGLGMRTGFELARGRIIGTLCADGQVAPRDLVRVYSSIADRKQVALAKVRRRFREDSWIRKLVSVAYNAIMHVLFPGLAGLDLNGNPKLAHREILNLMDLASDDWFLDAEIMLKARHLNIEVIEIDVPGYARAGGTSNVRIATLLEFLWNIARYRIGGPWRDWKRRTREHVGEPLSAPIEDKP